jgi:predicted flavoprotein YhiN
MLPPMSLRRVVIVGGGAAGFFAAIACAEASPGTEVVVLERGTRFLDKVRISGGGRCNVTHACFYSREFATRYPRGEKALLAPFQVFSASDTVAWFAARGVKLKTERDGRMFPVTDSSQTIVDCLMNAARAAGVKLRLNAGVERVRRREGGGFEVEVRGRGLEVGATNKYPHPGPLPFRKGEGEASSGETHLCDGLLLATGGCRAAVGGQLAVELGHTLEAPVPSLFTFHVALPWLRGLAGISVEEVEAEIPKDLNTQSPKKAGLRERGPLLITHWGVSAPLRGPRWSLRDQRCA